MMEKGESGRPSPSLSPRCWPEAVQRLRRALSAGVAATPTEGTPAFSTQYKAMNLAGTFLYGRIAALNPPLTLTPAEMLPVGAPTRDDVAALRLPTLFMIGTDDVLVAADDVREICALIPGATFNEFPGLGQSIYWEDAPAFNDALGAFLAEHLAGGESHVPARCGEETAAGV